MSKKLPPIADLSDIDLRLLRVFAAVIRHRGFAAAQDELRISASTISIHIRNLENRLGVRLCERGRKGFHISEQGQVIYDAILRLFTSIENFRGIVGSTRGQLVGDLHFGVVDAVATNSSIHIDRVISSFSNSAPEVTLYIDISSPQLLHQGLLEERYHVVLTPMLRKHVSVTYNYMFSERQLLYCGKNNTLFHLQDDRILGEEIINSQYAGRSYLLESKPPTTIDFPQRTAVAHMESTALLILSGKYIGYLPDHFAQHWVDNGLMRAICTETYTFEDLFYLGYRVQETNRAVHRFVECAELINSN